jgi:hypothetical protein
MAEFSKTQTQSANGCVSGGSTLEGAFIRIGASTAGCAAVGIAFAKLIGTPILGIAEVAGLVGLVAAVIDTVKSSKSAR